MGQLAFDRLLLLSHDADGVIGEDETFHINKGPKEPAYFLLHWIESMDLILPWKLTCPLKITGWKMYFLLK